MDSNLDSAMSASEDWLTIAIRDAIETKNSIVTYTTSQDIEKLPVAVSVPSTDAGAIDDINTPSLCKTADVQIGAESAYVGALSGAATWNSYEQALPPLQTLDHDLNGLQSDDEVDYEGSELEFYEALANGGMPYRRVKKHAPMSAEQQQTTMLHIEAKIRQFDDYKRSTDAMNATTCPEWSAVSNNNQDPEVCNYKADSPISYLNSAQSSQPNNGFKRGRGNKAPAREKKERKRQKKEINPETLNVLGMLIELGKPFEDTVYAIVDYARTESINKVRQDDNSVPLEELQKIEAEWKAEHTTKLKQLTAFLERFGLIPFGGVEAAGGGRDTLG